MRTGYEKIKRVVLETDRATLDYMVGNLGVTEIKRVEKNGEMARVDYFEIYVGDRLVAELHDYSIVEYE